MTRVLISRDGAAAEPWADALRARGLDPVLVPLTRIREVEDRTALDAALAALTAGDYDWLVVTSQNTVPAISGALGALPETTRVAAVGEATADALRESGARVDLVPRVQSAAGLLREWPGAAGERALLPSSSRAKPTLVHGLRSAGLTVDQVDVYDSAAEFASRDELAATGFAGVDVVVVSSGTVAEQVAALELDDRALVVAIGEQTAADCLELGLRVTSVADEPSADGIATAVIRAIEQTKRPVAVPVDRPRRLRTTEPMRRLVRETRIHASQLVLPMFVAEGISQPRPISAMPGQVQHTLDSLARAVEESIDAGVGGVMLFGVPEQKDAEGTQASDPDGILNRATRFIADRFGDATVVQTDLCLDEFTDHGHCGVLDSRGRVDNDATLRRFNEIALAQAAAGSQLLGMSGMMDGQVASARAALDAAGYFDTAILAYSAKYASALFGPFREAVDSSLTGHRRSYQQDPANRREGLREALLDLAEGADVVMVKPAAWYMDVLAEVQQLSRVPVWAYQVSGEYSMIEAAAANGWIERERAIVESVTSIVRAGADTVLTYWATEIARELR